MPVYQSVSISNFRCFRDFSLRGLAMVNLFAGPNNVGKTALLECMFQLSGPRNPALILNANALRGVTEYRLELSPTAMMPWSYLFHLLGTGDEIRISGQMAAYPDLFLRIRDVRPEEIPNIPVEAELGPQGPRSTALPQGPQGALSSQPLSRALLLQHTTGENGTPVDYYLIVTGRGILSYPPPGPVPFPGYFLGARTRVQLEEDARRFDEQDRHGRGETLLDALRILEPRLRGLRLHYLAGVPMIHGDIGLGRPIPLPYMGEGLARLASMILAISEAPGGVVFIDEIENGLYYKLLPDVWKTLANACRDVDAQVFATTHSRECIVAAHGAFQSSPSYDADFRLHRMEFAGDTVKAVSYDQETLQAAVETEMELR
jgi:hypothetical protein